MNKIFELKNVSKAYQDGSLGINDISLDIYQGEFIVIIGPSGAGKSTLLRCINYMNPLSTGSIIFKGNKVNGKSKKELRHLKSQIGMIFQHYNLIKRSSVVENVLNGKLGQVGLLAGLFNIYTHTQKQEAIDHLISIGLEEHIGKRADQLSGGQQQRVGIARALNQNPSLILADEPIASLDPASSKKVMDALHLGCMAQGITCIANLHQVDVAKKYATRIIGLKKGVVVFDGKPDDLDDDAIHELYN